MTDLSFFFHKERLSESSNLNYMKKNSSNNNNKQNAAISLAKRWINAGNRIVLMKGFFERMNQKLYLEEDRRREVYYEVDSNALGNMEYYVLIFLSCMIATLGLLNNSEAVIIGAMIVAPLMNPTMGIAMGIVRGDTLLLGRSLKTLAIGIVIAIAISCGVSFLIPNITDVTDLSQVMARTSPNILDIGIALAAGAAGAFAISRKKIASSLAGVAIAVSLMPPLAVTGIGLCLLLKTLKSTFLIGNFGIYFKIFSGSFILCFTNLVAINMSGIIVFTIFGFGAYSDKQKEARFHFITSILLLALMVFILTGFYAISLGENRTKNDVNQILEKEVSQLDPLAKMQGKPIIEIKFHKMEQGIPDKTISRWGAYMELLRDPFKITAMRSTDVQVTILCPFEPDDSYAFKTKALLEEKIGPVNLTLRFVNTTNMNIK